ncbi:nuclear transport factor 2 family protein [bacterium]|nr:nuclear transport factor 2 family protein [bacterium]
MTIPDSLQDYFKAIRNHDREAWLASFSDQPGLSQVDPVGSPARSSKAEIGAFWDQIHQLFARVELEAGTAFPGGASELALTWKGRGRGHNGVDVEFEGIDVVRLDSIGKILTLDAYWDAQATLSKLMP